MSELPIPPNEQRRLERLELYNILDTPAETQFDELTALAAQICDVPICLISLVDENRQWFKSRVGLDAPETPRNISFCQYAIMSEHQFEVEDSILDDRFRDNPLVTGDPKIRFYAGSPLLDQDGLSMGTLCVIDRKPRTLTDEQKTALDSIANTIMRLIRMRTVNEKLEMERKRTESVLVGANMGSWEWNVQSGKVRMNKRYAEIMGLQPSDLEPMTLKLWKEHTHPDDVEKVMSVMTQHFEKGSDWFDFEYRIKHADGHYVWVHECGKVLSWTVDEKPLRMYGTREEISSRKEMESSLKSAIAEAKKAAEAKDLFLANMSHEIRTPLNAIVGFTKLLSETPLLAKEAKYVRAISMASKNLSVLINDVLDIAKIEDQKLELERKAISIQKTITDVVQMSSESIKSKNLRLLTSIDFELPEFVHGDSTRLTQILVNLVSNAVKFTKEGRIELKVLVEEQQENRSTILFSVTDTGIGIPKDKQELIFERFAQAEDSTTREYGGSGLGLNIVRLLVELHGGEIWVESEENKGSTFSFRIEYDHAEEDQYMNLLDLDGLMPSSLNGIRILLAEDNEHNQILAQTFIERNNGVIELAENGEQAVELLRKKAFDCVLMDLQMPKMDGFQATQLIRREISDRIPIIACTAHSLVGEKKKATEVGMDDYITKPYSEQVLIHTILRTINGNDQPVTRMVQPEEIKNSEEDPKSDDILAIMLNMSETEGQDCADAMINVFQRRIPSDIDEIKLALVDKDLVTVRKKSHLIMGSLSSMNFKYGVSLAQQLEKHSANNDLDNTERSVLDLFEYLENTLSDLDKIKLDV